MMSSIQWMLVSFLIYTSVIPTIIYTIMSQGQLLKMYYYHLFLLMSLKNNFCGHLLVFSKLYCTRQVNKYMMAGRVNATAYLLTDDHIVFFRVVPF